MSRAWISIFSPSMRMVVGSIHVHYGVDRGANSQHARSVGDEGGWA